MTSPPEHAGAVEGRARQWRDLWTLLEQAGYRQAAELPYFQSRAASPAFLRRTEGSNGVPSASHSGRSSSLRRDHERFRASQPEIFDLFALFSLGSCLPLSRLQEILPADAVNRLRQLDALADSQGRIRARVRILQWNGLVFLHDMPARELPLSDRGYMGRDSLRFADYLHRELQGRSFDRALDLGTGCGIQAHVLAQFSARTAGLDTNPLALEFARANSALNGRDGIEFILGDLADPPPHRYDLVVSNPPFLYLPRPLPQGRDTASDGGLLGMGPSRRILSRLDRLLTPRGEAHILVPLTGSPRRPVLEDWMRRRLLPQGLSVELKPVEYLWRDDQYDAYHARGITTPLLAVARVQRSSSPTVRMGPVPWAEKLILTRKERGIQMSRRTRKLARTLAAASPARLARLAPLGFSCLAHSPHVPVPPLRLACEPSTACPLDCQACARRERIHHERNLDPMVFERMLRSMRPRIMHLHGSGEPLAHPEIHRLCGTAREAGCSVALITSLPTEETVDRAVRTAPYLDRLIVGMDAAHPETYDLVRRGEGLRGVQERFRVLRRLRHIDGADRPAMIASFLILKDNYREAAEFVRMAWNLGADAALFLTLDLYTIENRRSLLIGDVSPEKILKSLRRARRAAERVGLATNLDLILARPEIIRHRYGDAPVPSAGPCLRPWLSTYVTVDGKIRPCSRYAYDSGADVGDVTDHDFLKEIWNGQAYQELRRDLRTGRPTFRACPGCAVPAEEGTLLTNLWRRRRSP